MNRKSQNIIRILIFIPELLLYLYYICKYRKIDYFQYEVLAKSPMRIPRIRKFRTNLLYGNYFAIKNLSDKISLYRDYLEHGIIFCDHIGTVFTSKYIDINKCRNIYTYSENRKRILEKYNKKLNIIPVGPYILGASFFYDTKTRSNIKKKFGKILLVFPSHSTKSVQTHYDKQAFINEILRIQDNFQSVFVCLHRLDIVNNQYQEFLNSNFIIVTAGSPEDIKFLSRLKDLIELSDMTMSNSLGTHIGYSICMKKPHYLFYQPTNFILSDKITKYQENYEFYEDNEKQKLSFDFSRIFGTFSREISQEQISICQNYWGIYNAD
jgi:hypothetical protein